MKISYALVLGSILFDLRKNKNLFMEAIAEVTKISAAQLSRTENGKTPVIMDNLIRICEALDCGLGQLFTQVDARVELLAKHGIVTVRAIEDTDATTTITTVKVLNQVLQQIPQAA
jgi:transcriptional regulator with XRE-family HTH domain